MTSPASGFLSLSWESAALSSLFSFVLALCVCMCVYMPYTYTYIASWTLFWKDLLNATFIYSWSFTPENDYQAVSLSLFKHFIKTYTPLLASPWLPNDTHAPHISVYTHLQTAHAGNTCNLKLYVFALHVPVEEFLLKTKQNVNLAKQPKRTTRKIGMVSGGKKITHCSATKLWAEPMG